MLRRALPLNLLLGLLLIFISGTALAQYQLTALDSNQVKQSTNTPDPQIVNAQAAMASAHFFAGRYAEAASWAEMAVREQPNHFIAACMAAASGALGGRLAEAQKAMGRLRELDPALRISNLEHLFPIRHPEDFAKWEEGMRRAGLPE